MEINVPGAGAVTEQPCPPSAEIGRGSSDGESSRPSPTKSMTHMLTQTAAFLFRH